MSPPEKPFQQEVTIEQAEGMATTPRLADLMAEMPDGLPIDQEWEQMPSVGNELLEDKIQSKGSSPMAEFKADTRFSKVGELTPDTSVLGQPAKVWQETFAGEAYQRNLDAALEKGQLTVRQKSLLDIEDKHK